jgi:hypothetical protein
VAVDVIDADVPTKTVEVMIKREIYEAARERAAREQTELAGIGKQIVWLGADSLHPIDGPGLSPDTGVRGVVRRRLRMTVPARQWDTDRDRIHAAGESVARVIEHGLAVYVLTGKIAAPGARLPAAPPKIERN